MEELPNPNKKCNVMDTGGVGGILEEGLLIRPAEQIIAEKEISL